ncbi:MAG: beta strand repeat-containing protein [Acidimicrobiales bacterium]
MRGTLRRALIGSGTAVLAIGSVLFGFLTPAAQASPRPHTTTTTGGSYVAVTPARIADTRSGSGMPYAGQTLSAGGTLNVQVTGAGGVPTTNVCAAVLNVTDAGSTASGFLTVFPQGAIQPGTSSLNFVANQIVANQVTVPVSATGMVSIFNHTGNTNVVVDVDGYYTCSATTASAGLYNAVSPVRALGSLTSGAAIAANTSMPVTVTGTTTGVPATATAVVVNLTAAGGTTSSFLAAYPAGGTLPTVSNLNFNAGQVIANRATVGIGTNGQIEVYNHTGSVNVDVDVEGYYGAAGSGGASFFPITPVRLTDTRVPMNGTPIAANTTEAFSLANSAIAAKATAVQTNMTVVPGTAAGFLTVYPTSDTTNPVASDVNWVGTTLSPALAMGIPNATIADTSGSSNESVNIYNGPAVNGGTINLVIDAFGYFATPGPAATGLTVTASPSSITSSTSSTSTITVQDNNGGTPVAGDQVLFAVTGTNCGTVSPTTAVTNSTGSATTTYTASTTSGSCTVTATEADYAYTSSTVITQTGPPNTVTVTTSAPSVAANGAGAASITAAVTSPAGLAVANDTVTFSVAPSPAGSCGTVSPTTATTNASGIVAVSYLSSSTSGFCAITATEAATGGSGTGQIIQTSSPNPGYTVLTTNTASVTPAVAGSTVTVTASLSSGVANSPVEFTTSGASTCGAFTNTGAVLTNASGVATDTYTAANTATPCVVTATDANSANSGNSTILQAAADNVAVSLNPASIPANGSSFTAVTASVTTATGAPVANSVVTFSSTDSGGRFLSTTATTTSSGVATDDYISSTTPGFPSITAVAAATTTPASTPGGSGSATLDQTAVNAAGTPYVVTVASSPASVPASGSATALTITVNNSSGTAVPGDSVSLSTNSAAACGSLSASSGVTNTSGVVTASYTPGTTAGTCVITATEASDGQAGSTTITQTAPLNTVTVTTSAGAVPANGAGAASISASVLSPSGLAVSGDTVTFAVAPSPAGSCGTVSPATATTNTSGVAAVSYLSSSTSGFCTITATESGTTGSGTAMIVQTIASPPSGSLVYNVSNIYDPTTGIVTATVTTSTGVAVAGDPVMFAPSAATAADCGTLATSSAVITNSLGQATDAYTPANVTGACDIVANEANDNQVGTAVINQTAFYNVGVSANPAAIAATGSSTSTITVTVTNAAGAPVSGAVVDFTVSAGGGTFSSTTGTTNAAGQTAVVYISSVSTGFYTITANIPLTPGSSGTVTIDQTS